MYSLNEQEAFEAMRRFLDAFYWRTNGGELAVLLTDMQVQEDGSTYDPAAWDDWLRFVREVKDENENQPAH